MQFTLSGTVIKGLGIGKKLGLPRTANLKIARLPKSLKPGIYAAQIKTSIGEFNGVVHFGLRPAVKAPKSFEVHCFGLRKNMYGKRMTVKLIKRLRGVKNFKTISALKKAIEGDIRKAKKILNNMLKKR